MTLKNSEHADPPPTTGHRARKAHKATPQLLLQILVDRVTARGRADTFPHPLDVFAAALKVTEQILMDETTERFVFTLTKRPTHD